MKKANYWGYIGYRIYYSKLFLVLIALVFSILFGMYAAYGKGYEEYQNLLDLLIDRTNSSFGAWNHIIFVLFYLAPWILVVHHVSGMIKSPQLVLATGKKTTLSSIKMLLFLFLSFGWLVVTNIIVVGIYLLVYGMPIFESGQTSTFLFLSLFKVLTFFCIACLIHTASYFVKNISVVFIIVQGILLIDPEIGGLISSVLWLSQGELPQLTQRFTMLLVIDCGIVALGYLAEWLTDPLE